MSIECKPSTSSAHKAEGAHGKGVKAKSAGDPAQDAGPLGFMAALTAAEESSDAQTAVADDAGSAFCGAPPVQPPGSEALTPVDASTVSLQSPQTNETIDLKSKLNPDKVGQQPNRKNLVAGQTPELDLSMELATGVSGTTATNSQSPGVVADTADVRRTGLDNAIEAVLKSDESKGNAEVNLTGLQAARLASPPQNGKDMSVEPAAKGGRKPTDKAKLDRSVSASDAPAAGNTSNLSAQEVRDPRDIRFQAVMDLQKLLQPETEDVVSVLPTLVRDEKRIGERSVFSATSDSVTANPGISSGTPELGDLGFSAVAEVSVPPEVQVAEQVQFWISKEIQNAEMQLDGIGEKPVEVSISMNGNEAHVAFRSDELLARGVLAGAEAHLRDMLEREGLVLTGVSVGTSSGGGPGSEGRQQRQGERKAMTVSPANLPENRTIRTNSGLTGRSLDLFV